MSGKIPITFEYEGREYKGYFSPVMGSGNTRNTVFDLIVENRFWGTLRYIEGSVGINGLHAVPPGWVFHSNTKGLEHLAEYFSEVVVLWYE